MIYLCPIATFSSTAFATEYNRIFIFKDPIKGKILPGHVIRTEKVANEGSCRVKCFLEPNCVSINVGPPDDQGQRTCELNNFTDESPSQTNLQEKPGHIHHAVEVLDIFAINFDQLQRVYKRLNPRTYKKGLFGPPSPSPMRFFLEFFPRL